MAPTTTLRQSLNTSTGTGPYTVTSFTPTAGSLLVVFVVLPDHPTYGQATVTDSLGELTFVRDTNQPRFDTSNGSIYCFTADRPAQASARTLSVGIGSDAATGCIALVYEVFGPTKFGTSAIKKVAIQSNGVAGTPNISWLGGGTSSGDNVNLFVLANRTNPPAMTTPTGTTEAFDNGFATPDTGVHSFYASEVSGGYTWGTVSATAKGIFGVEIDCSQSDPMPTEGLADFNLIFSDDFNTDKASFGTCSAYGTGVPPDRMCSGLGAEYENKFWAYPTSYPDTRQQQSADGGYYNPAAMSMTKSFLKMVLSRTAGVTAGCALIPKLFGSFVHTKQTFGRYAVRWWSESDPDLKVAWLLYRQEDDWGETDYPEADLNSYLQSFVHLNPYPGEGDPQEAYVSDTLFAGEWHTAIIEWRPGSWKFYLDGELINSESGVDAYYGENLVTQGPMSWILQCESRMGGAAPPATIADTTILIDWVAVWKYVAPIDPDPEPEPEPEPNPVNVSRNATGVAAGTGSNRGDATDAGEVE